MIELAFCGWTVFAAGLGLLIGYGWGRDNERADAEERSDRACRVRGGR